MEPTAAQRAALDKMTAEIAAAAGPALPGTLIVRAYACGKPNCRCHADPTRRLTPRQLAEYQPLFDTAKKLRALLSELQDLTLEIIEADSPRQQQSPEQETRGPENVGEARLTCGHPPSQTPFAQVRPKREDVSTGITCKARSEAHWTAPIVRSG